MTYFAFIERPDATSPITVSKLLPNAEHFVTTYGHLLNPGECITLVQFSQRITKVYGSPFVQIEAGELHRWQALMAYCEDCILNENTMPTSFEWTDGTYKILGEEAVDWLTRKIGNGQAA